MEPLKAQDGTPGMRQNNKRAAALLKDTKTYHIHRYRHTYKLTQIHRNKRGVHTCTYLHITHLTAACALHTHTHTHTRRAHAALQAQATGFASPCLAYKPFSIHGP